MNDYTLTGPKVNHKAAYREAAAAAVRTTRAADVARDAALRTLAAQAATRYAGEQLRISKGLVIALNHGATLQADGTALVQSQTEPEIVYTVNGHCDCADATHGAPDGRCKHRWAKTLTVRALALDAEPALTITTLSEQLSSPQDAAAAAQRTACGQPAARKETAMAPVMTEDEDDEATLQAALDAYNQMAAAEAAPSPAACPEAMFSITLKGTMGGHDAMLTARGSSFEEFMTNVQRLQGLLDAPAPSQPASTPGSQPAAPPAPLAAPVAEATTRACPIHHVLMTEQHNGRGAWWSHRREDGSWCKGR
jgi:hypothetical protein